MILVAVGPTRDRAQEWKQFHLAAKTHHRSCNFSDTLFPAIRIAIKLTITKSDDVLLHEMSMHLWDPDESRVISIVKHFFL